jgi:hypothetical protein
MQKDNLRYERKFIDKSINFNNINFLLKKGTQGFREKFPSRYVNNIYLDDYKFSFFSKNYNGLFNRIKYRIRWYGDIRSEIKSPVLELKIKNGLLGYKLHYPLKPFLMKKLYLKNNFKQLINNSDIPDLIKENMKYLKPTLFNRYKRKYFISSIFPHCRITMDNNLIYAKPEKINFINTFINKPIIIEFKYPWEVHTSIDYLSNKLSLRLSKFSKYVNGIIYLYR